MEDLSFRHPERNVHVRSHEGTQYFDFLSDELPADLSLQRRIYDNEQQRFYTPEQDRKEFMQTFVRDRLQGQAKGKERRLIDELKNLHLTSESRVLELGCNDGRYLNLVTAMYNCTGVGVDISESTIKNAVSSEIKGKNTFVVADVSSLPFRDASFDAVISFDVFEHLTPVRLMETIEESFRVLVPGGRFVAYIVSQKDRYCVHETIRRVSAGRFGNDAAEGHSYENFVHPDTFESLSIEAGFREIKISAYHAFWTLLADEVYGGKLGPRTYRLFEILDWPLTRHRYGNGFFATMRKAR